MTTSTGRPKMDDFLSSRMKNYSRWLANHQIDYSAKVVPIDESIENKQWVLHTDQVIDIVSRAETIALTDCLCRSHYKRCSNPLNVCLLLDEIGRKSIEKGDSRQITVDESTSVLKAANAKGLVHLSLYRPDHTLFALCSCCPCCCHDLQLLLKYDQRALIAHADYVAFTDVDGCIHCGECVQRCYFDARTQPDEQMIYDADKCYGCGLCVCVCPVEATTMRPKSGSGTPTERGESVIES